MKKQALFLTALLTTVLFTNVGYTTSQVNSIVITASSAIVTDDEIAYQIFERYAEIVTEVYYPTGEIFAIAETESSKIYYVYIVDGVIIKMEEFPNT